MKFSVLVLLLCLLAFAGHADDLNLLPATVTMTDGSELEGQVDFSFDNLSEEILFLSDDSNKQLSVADIGKISIPQTGAETIVLVRKAVNGAFNKRVETLWMQELITGSVSLYADARNGFVHFRNGTLYKMDSDITFYLQRENEEGVSLAGVYYTSAFNVNADNTFRKLTTSYFNDCSDLVRRLHDREFGIVEIGMVVEYYNQFQARNRSASPSS